MDWLKLKALSRSKGNHMLPGQPPASEVMTCSHMNYMHEMLRHAVKAATCNEANHM